MSRAILNYSRGMHWTCVRAHEFEGLNGAVYRVEVYEENGELKVSSYRRQRAYWIPFSNQQLAMEKRALLNQATVKEEI